jgi:hypothetical protein
MLLEIAHETNCLLRTEENRDHGLESLIGRTMHELLSDFWCIEVRTVGFKSEEITAEIYQGLRLPITTVIDKKCKGHAIISDNEIDLLELVCNINPSSENRLVILVLNAISLILDHSNIFGEADVILASVDKMYRLTMSATSRYFKEVASESDLLPVKTTSLPDLMGRTLQVGTFFCPPFSFGTAGNVSSAEAEVIADGEFPTSLLFHYSYMLDQN